MRQEPATGEQYRCRRRSAGRARHPIEEACRSAGDGELECFQHPREKGQRERRATQTGSDDRQCVGEQSCDEERRRVHGFVDGGAEGERARVRGSQRRRDHE